MAMKVQPGMTVRLASGLVLANVRRCPKHHKKFYGYRDGKPYFFGADAAIEAAFENEWKTREAIRAAGGSTFLGKM